MKKIGIGIVAIIIIAIGYRFVSSMNLTGAKAQTQAPITTTTAPSILDGIKSQISALQVQETTNNAVIQAELEKIENEIAALTK
jgi:hypothetical protein